MWFDVTGKQRGDAAGGVRDTGQSQFSLDPANKVRNLHSLPLGLSFSK